MPKLQKGLVGINLSSKAGTRIESVFFSWAVNAGKIIIILTELVALSALGYRFVVDRQIVDLHDQIKREKILLDGQKDKEQEYRNIQTRLTQVQTISFSTKSKIDIMNNILSAINNGNFSSTTLSLDQSEFTIEGYATSVFTINNFINAVKQYPEVTTISLDDIESSDKGIRFRLLIDLKNNGQI